MDLNGKNVCFLGDSITEHGFYVYDLRSYFHYKKIKCSVYNCGIGGNRAIMSYDLLDAETANFKPDYIVINYGINDMGIWLYDVKNPETEEIIRQREERDKDFYFGYERTVRAVKDRGIIPIIASTVSVDEKISQDGAVETLGDNAEKAEKLKAEFYLRKNFTLINQKLSEYSQNLKKLAERENVPFMDIQKRTYEDMLNKSGLYNKDGIHLTETGHAQLAVSFLKEFGYVADVNDFKKDADNDEIFKVEQTLRKIQVLDWAHFHPIYRNVPKNIREQKARELLYDKETRPYFIEYIKTYLENHDKVDEIADDLIRKTDLYCK